MLLSKMETNAGVSSTMDLEAESQMPNATMSAAKKRVTHAVARTGTVFGTSVATTATRATSLCAEPESTLHQIAPLEVGTTQRICACRPAEVKPKSASSILAVLSA